MKENVNQNRSIQLSQTMATQLSFRYFSSSAMRRTLQNDVHSFVRNIFFPNNTSLFTQPQKINSHK